MMAVSDTALFYKSVMGVAHTPKLIFPGEKIQVWRDQNFMKKGQPHLRKKIINYYFYGKLQV